MLAKQERERLAASKRPAPIPGVPPPVIAAPAPVAPPAPAPAKPAPVKPPLPPSAPPFMPGWGKKKEALNLEQRATRWWYTIKNAERRAAEELQENNRTAGPRGMFDLPIIRMYLQNGGYEDAPMPAVPNSPSDAGEHDEPHSEDEP